MRLFHRLSIVLLLLLPVPVLAAEVPFAFTAGGGELTITPNHDLLASLGITLEGGERGRVRFALGEGEAVLVELGDGAPTALRGGSLPVRGLRFVRKDGARSPVLSLRATPGGGVGVEFVDAGAAVWARVGDAMRSPDPEDGLRLISADLRVGPALATWTGTDSAGLLLGGATLQVPLTMALGAPAASAKSCSAPNWAEPGNGWHVDVQLTGINSVGVPRCRMSGEIDTDCRSGLAYTCDGPGADNGEVVFLPSAMLRNSDALDAAEVPWFAKFAPPSTSVFPSGIDQHPFLVWNLYRMDPDGALTQIGRSSLKHAFATQNTGCVDSTCNTRHNILGRGCSDGNGCNRPPASRGRRKCRARSARRPSPGCGPDSAAPGAWAGC